MTISPVQRALMAPSSFFTPFITLIRKAFDRPSITASRVLDSKDVLGIVNALRERSGRDDSAHTGEEKRRERERESE